MTFSSDSSKIRDFRKQYSEGDGKWTSTHIVYLHGTGTPFRKEGCGEPFSWGNISPTNFGCIFESTIDKEVRDSGGMHYTTSENIHRAIDPLFLGQLETKLAEIIASDSYENTYERDQDLEAFRLELANLRFLDPACGSGNFLTEIYKALYRLDMKAFKHMSFKERERSFNNIVKMPCYVIGIRY